MAKTIKLGGINADSKIEFDGKEVYTLSAADANAKRAVVPGVGTFTWTSTADAKFVAEAGLTDEISFDATSVTVVSADFGNNTTGITFTGDANVTTFAGGAGNDTLIGVTATTSINAGAGNDFVSIDAGATGTNVTLGAGADTLDISAVTGADNKVFDYNYFEGDVIKVGSGEGVTLKATGEASVGSAANELVADKVAVQDNWYGVKINNGTADIDYFTAVNNNNLTVSKDLSNSVIANVVDASGAKNANITLGHKNDTVTLSTVSGVDTIKVGKSAGSNTLKNFNATDDIIAIDGVKMSDVSIDASSANLVLKYAATTLDTGNATAGASTGSLNFNDGSKNHKLVYDISGTASTISYATASDADWAYSSDANGQTVLEVGATTHLHETDKYVNITNISVSGSAKLDAPISLTGATGKANKIDATQAKVGTAVWGFSNGADSITLGSGQDTVWFGANDGKDTVTKFTYGTASDSDVLYLKDTKSLKDINVSVDGAGTNALFTVSKNDVLTMNTVAASGANNVAQIKLADEKIYKVAGNVEKANTVTVDTDNTDGLDFYAFDKTQAQTVVLKGGKDWVVNSLYTDFYTTGATIGAIDANAATGNVTLAAAASIKGGAGTNNIWTYQSDAAASVVAGAGTDIIWFAENADQAVSVSSFTAGTDVVKFATAQSLKEIADNYSFATVTGGTADAKITGVNNTDSNMTIAKAGTSFGAFTITDANDKAYKALVSNGNAGTATFSADVNIYAGMATLEASKDFEGTVSVRVGKESRGLSSDTYFIDDKVITFDASKSTATFWVAGNANAATTIKGGLTENYLYGGGAASDELFGSVAAKDTFYFGTGDGTDKISGGVDKEDTIALWNVADADIANVSVSINKSNQVEISLSDSSKLTITDANGATALTDGLTFTSASQTAYTYDSKSKTLVKKA